MVDLRYRSGEQELLDAEDIPFADIITCLRELNTVNTFLGGHAVTLAGIKSFYRKNEPLHICEIGCGGGDNIAAIAKKYGAHSGLIFTGIDLKRECIEYAASENDKLAVDWVVKNYEEATFPHGKPSIIFSSLFCHHFTDGQLVAMLQWMRDNATKGFFINDLQRSTVAYYLIKWLTHFFSRSYLVKNDAAVSVARSFRKKDWKRIFNAAGIKTYSIKWKWAFRYLVICKND